MGLNSDGNMRYYLGAQVDVSGLLKNCSGMDSLVKLIEHGGHHGHRNQNLNGTDPATDIQPLSEMLSGSELDTVGKYGGVLHKSVEDQELQSKTPRKTAFTPNRVILADGSDDSDQGEIMSSRPQQQQQQSNEANGETHLAGVPPQEINLSLVYKNVSPLPRQPHGTNIPDLTVLPVPHHPPHPISPRPLRLPNSPSPRHGPIALPAPHRRKPHAQRSQHFLPRRPSRNSSSPLAVLPK